LTGGSGHSATPDGRLLAYAPGARPLLGFAVACGLVAASLVVVAAYLTSTVVARVFLGDASFGGVGPTLAVIAALAIVRLPLLVGVDLLAGRASRRLKETLRADLTAHLLALGPAWMSRERSGELAGTIGGGVDSLEAYIASYQPARALAVAVPLLVIVGVLAIDPPTALVLLFTGPVLVLLLVVIGGRARAVTDRRFSEIRYLGAFFLDMLRGLPTLKMFGRGPEQVANISAISRRFGDTTMDVLRTAFQTALVLEWGAAVAVAVVAVEVSLRLMDGSIEFQRALAVLIIVPEFFLPLRTLAMRYHSGAEGRTVAERIFVVLDEPLPDRRGPAPRGSGIAVPAAAEILFGGVTVTYPGRTAPALDGFDLVIPDRGVVALVGTTGSGKTTAANLLLRFIEPDAGVIRAGGLPLGSIDIAAWRSHVAWVPQRPYLFHGTVADNIRLARPGASDAEIRSAADEAGAATFIDAMALAYDTPVGEDGVRLSGGQRQRIALARAFLTGARLVILDEATSHLDAASEDLVRDAVARMGHDRAVLVVSHRLRLVSVADTIAVVDRGRVVQVGAPADLAARDGPFRRLLATDPADDDS
jgi:ATP-binding cassette, subfamily C, bacterial CydD